MKIAFFSESQVRGKIPRDFLNARTEYAWMMALDAPHYNINNIRPTYNNNNFNSNNLIRNNNSFSTPPPSGNISRGSSTSRGGSSRGGNSRGNN